MSTLVFIPADQARELEILDMPAQGEFMDLVYARVGSRQVELVRGAGYGAWADEDGLYVQGWTLNARASYFMMRDGRKAALVGDVVLSLGADDGHGNVRGLDPAMARYVVSVVGQMPESFALTLALEEGLVKPEPCPERHTWSNDG